MTADPRNTDLSKWIDEPWAHPPCPCREHNAERVGEGDCPCCWGEGYVPVPLHEPEYTLRLIGWAGSRPWYSVMSRFAGLNFVPQLDERRDVDGFALRIRDLIHQAEKEWREKS